MHDLLIARQDRLTDADLKSYAEEIGLDGDRVVGEAAQPFGDKVEADFAAGLLAGVPGTPTLFVNGRRYAGRVEPDALRRAIGAAMTMSGASLSGGEPGLEPGPRRKRRLPFGLRRAQREALAEEPQQQDPDDGGGR